MHLPSDEQSLSQGPTASTPEIAHVLFMDCVSYSLLPMDHQNEMICQLQGILRQLPDFEKALSAGQLICLPTGDGMALAFFSDLTSPIRYARQIAQALKKDPRFQLRMGIHTGPVYRIADINANRNVSGGGINFAQRVMDCGDAGHILMSKATADMLVQLGSWEAVIHDLGEVTVKHGVKIHIFNVFSEEFGNPQTPSKIAGQLLQTGRDETSSNSFTSSNGRRRLIAAALVVAALLAGWSVKNALLRWRTQPSPEAMQLYRMGTEDLQAAAYFAATKALEQATRLASDFPLAHARLAESWMDLELPEKAGVEMLLARRNGTAGLSSFDRLQIEAIEHSITRDFAVAVSKYHQMLLIAGPQRADVYLDLGRTYESAEQIPNALENYVLASEAAPRNPAAWLRLAALHSRAPQQRVQAHAEFEKAEQLFRVTSNLEGLTEVAYWRSVDANRRGELEENAAQARKALETARLTGNIHQEIRAMLQLGSTAFFAGDAALAESYARQAIDTARANHIDSLAIRGVIVLGNAHLRSRDVAGAERYYDDALSMARRDNTRWLASQALLALASLHQSLNRDEEASREAQEALDFYRSNHFARESVQCLTLIGRVKRDRGDPAALDYFLRSLEIAQQADDSFLIALAHESLGGLLKAQERLPAALTHYRRELQLSTDAQHIGWAAFNCAEALLMLGRLGEIGDVLEKAEANALRFADLREKIAMLRAEIALTQGQFADAAGRCHRALAASPGPGDTARLIATLGMAEIASGNANQGRRNCEAALSRAENLGDMSLRVRVQLAAAEARLKTGDRAAALALIHQMEPSVADMPLSCWRVMALAARADHARAQEYAAAAKHQLDGIAREWGSPAFQLYVARPDVHAMFQTISHLITADNR
jgi:tetratricopeptide (TPR) repeat protein